MKGLKSAIKWIAAIVIICVVAVFLASINGLHVRRTAITVDGSIVTEAELKFYVENVKQQVFQEQGITDEEAAKKFLKEGKVGDKSAKDYIRDLAVENAVEVEKMVVLAKKADIKLTDEERDTARSTKGMEETLKEIGIDKETWSTIREKEELANKYYAYLYENKPEIATATAEEVAAKSGEYALVQHVLISNTPEANEDGSVPETEGYAEAAKEEAERILKRALNGEDFATLVETYGKDPGMESNPEGYLINKEGFTLDGSQMMQEFTDGAFAVNAGEVNPQLVETSYGYHIIKRCVIEKKAEVPAEEATPAENAEETAEATPADGEEAATQEAAPSAYEQLESVVISEKIEAYIKAETETLKVVKKDKIIKKLKIEF